MFLKLALTAGLLLWASFAVTPAKAAPVPVTFAFKGMVESISDGLLNGTGSGDTSPFGSSPFISGSLLLSGSYTLDLSIPGTNQGGGEVRYDNPILNVTFQLRNASNNNLVYDSPLSTPSGNFIVTLNNPSLGDQYGLVLGPFAGSEVNSRAPEFFAITLIAPFDSFGSTASSTPPSLGSLSSTLFHVGFSNVGLGFQPDRKSVV